MPTPRLSKSKFTTALQCHKWLWWEVHEPNAPELAEIDPATQLIFDQGHEVGCRAQQYVPDGILIDIPNTERQRLLEKAELFTLELSTCRGSLRRHPPSSG